MARRAGGPIPCPTQRTSAQGCVCMGDVLDTWRRRHGRRRRCDVPCFCGVRHGGVALSRVDAWLEPFVSCPRRAQARAETMPAVSFQPSSSWHSAWRRSRSLTWTLDCALMLSRRSARRMPSRDA